MEFGEPASCKVRSRVLLVGARRDGRLCEQKILMNENCNTMSPRYFNTVNNISG